ncbi:MAG: PQQ-dependent dehydrogenase, methanol/ethanol family [Gammaproteobacteria bacterium]|nr:PQQ-dependent dehydrogenase, methanol/ethanol family [Gammaproteobacteria bacterium]
MQMFRLALAPVLALVAGLASAADTVVDDRYLANHGDGANWAAYGHDSSEQRYSPLDQINTGNVKELGLAWALDMPGERALIGTPLAVDGVLYFTGTWSYTRAVDAKTGKLLWEYDPKVIEHAGDRLRIMWESNKGPAYYKGKLVISTVDGRLVALDAKTGKMLWETMTIDPRRAYYITGAPKVFRDKVIIGNGGTEHEAARGYVTAYDIETGKQAWRFYIVPGNPAEGFEDKAMEMAAKTWTGEWWKYGGGGNVWNGITYDPEFNQVLLGTGNGSPWNQKIRSPGGGDNLFLCSIVALDADTGAYKWHYQTVPGETWDYNSSMDIVLADLKYGGQTIKALMHAPKNGFFYVINRANGELLSAEKFGKVTWAERIDLKTGRPVEIKGARYDNGEAMVWPSPVGAHSWHPMSYSPQTGLVYIPAIEMAGVFVDKGMDLKAWKSPHFHVDPGVVFATADTPKDWSTASLLAWDPVKQQKVWSQPLPPNWNPGTMVTKGNLVFQGRADGELVAYDATSGAKLWSVNAGSGLTAAPITYSVDGKQYVAQLVGWGGAGLLTGSLAAQHGWKYGVHPRRLLTFALGGKAPMPPSPPPAFAKPLDVPDFKVDDKLAAEGLALYAKSCVQCHGSGVVSGGTAPDLRESPMPLTLAGFKSVVVDGGRLARGMPKFAEITDGELERLQHYIRQQARASLAAAAAH